MTPSKRIRRNAFVELICEKNAVGDCLVVKLKLQIKQIGSNVQNGEKRLLKSSSRIQFLNGFRCGF